MFDWLRKADDGSGEERFADSVIATRQVAEYEWGSPVSLACVVVDEMVGDEAPFFEPRVDEVGMRRVLAVIALAEMQVSDGERDGGFRYSLYDDGSMGSRGVRKAFRDLSDEGVLRRETRWTACGARYLGVGIADSGLLEERVDEVPAEVENEVRDVVAEFRDVGYEELVEKVERRDE